MNGKSEGTGKTVSEAIEELRSGKAQSADTRAVCDKLDFLGRFVVAAIIGVFGRRNTKDATEIADELYERARK
jgi:hypothetical protein